MQRVLVTGANGFIGAAICAGLLAKGWSVSGSVRSADTALDPKVSPLITGPLDGSTDWTATLDGLDAVVHCAARVHVLRETEADPLAAFRKVNVAASEGLARQSVAAEVRRLVFLSSIGAAVAERSPERASPYQRSKLEAEAALKAVTAGTATSLVVLRPPLVYGAGAPGNFPRLAKAVARGLPLPLASLRNRRSLLYLGNLVSAVEAALTADPAPESPLELCDGDDISTPDLARRIGQLCGRPARLLPCPPALLRLAGALTGRSAAVEALTTSLTVDNGPITKALGWRPPYGLQDGLTASVAKPPEG